MAKTSDAAGRLSRLGSRLRAELAHVARVQPSDRPWQLPLAAALAAGLPLMVAAAHGRLALGLPASLGGLVFLYLPRTSLAHRMGRLMACAFGLVMSQAVGMLCHQLPHWAPVPLLGLVTTLAMMVCRFYAVGPPAALFFVMAAAISAYTPVTGMAAFAGIGLLALGSVLAVAIAFPYSLWTMRSAPPLPDAPPPPPDFDHVVTESVLIGGFVALSLLVAHIGGLPRPYWVPVSCLAVIQGASLRAVWVRQVHRVAGTALGLGLFGTLAQTPLTPWHIALIVTGLSFIVETLVVRHYGAAVVFITPLAVLLAEAAQLPGSHIGELLRARLLDTVLGSVIGLAGGAALHLPGPRAALGRGLRRVFGGGGAERA